jgi:hypothetical protein
MPQENSVSLAKMYQLTIGLIAMVALLLAYLAPSHFLPWTTFYEEWFFAIFVGLGLAWVISYGRLVLADIRVWLLILLLASLHTWAWGEVTPMRATLWVVFVLFALVGWLAYSLGLNLRQTPWLKAVLVAIWLAAMVSAVIAVLQWSGVVFASDWGPEFVMLSEAGGRAYSNIGQANNLGTLLVLGMGIVGYAWYAPGSYTPMWRGLAVLSLSVLVMGAYFCGSRTALLNLALWPLLLFGWARWRRKPWPWLALLPIAILAALHLVMPTLSEWWGLPPAQEARAGGIRPRIWMLAMTAISEHFWLGGGLGALTNAHLRLAPELAPFDWAIVNHAHNTVLDLWVIFGIPFGTTIVLAGLWLWVRAWLQSQNIAEQFLWAMATAMLVHGMLEFPLHYGFFFWLWCLLLGVLGGKEWKAWSLRGSALAVSMGWLVMFLSVALPARLAYTQMEELYSVARTRGPTTARAMLITTPPALGQYLFPELYERLRWMTTPTETLAALSDTDLAALETEASWYPLPRLGWSMAIAYAARGNAEQAAWWAERMCRTFRPERCAEAAEDWRRRHAEQPAWPELPFDKWQLEFRRELD